jgi:hypothetical protein
LIFVTSTWVKSPYYSDKGVSMKCLPTSHR